MKIRQDTSDKLIRHALKHKLLRRHINDPHALVVDELGIRHGSARIDIAVINSLIHGFEIKSDLDGLMRLPEQMRIYNSVLDRITLIVGYRHASAALHLVPEWWGVKLVHIGPRGAITFSEARRPRANPVLDGVAIAKLLWRDEALALLDEFGQAQGYTTRPRLHIYQRLNEVLDLEQLRFRVRRQLLERRGWRSDLQQKSYDG